MKNKIVLGLSFGDEGKGLFTDYLASQYPNSIVIRFSGGHQAGHMVVVNNINVEGRVIRHIFTNIGAGTLRGVPTYWSRFCTVEPIGLINELKILKDKLIGININPLIYINEKCPVTTPYDILNNHKLEKKNSHGSCGVGFGSTLEREEKHYSLTVLDLFYPDVLIAKLRTIKNYYGNNANVTEFYKCCEFIRKNPFIKIVSSLPVAETYIFEGAQGLLLDQNYGFFPNVSRTNAGMKNITRIMPFAEYVNNNYELFLITRAYQTRHGNGFMTNENVPHNIIDNPLETNKENTYQGKFRKTLLDVSLLEYAMKKDDYIKKAPYKSLVITCLDHIVNDYRFFYKGEMNYCDGKMDFVSKVTNILNIKNIYISENNNSANIVKIGGEYGCS